MTDNLISKISPLICCRYQEFYEITSRIFKEKVDKSTRRVKPLQRSKHGKWTECIYCLPKCNRVLFTALFGADRSQDISLCNIRCNHRFRLGGQCRRVYYFKSYSSPSDQHVLFSYELGHFRHRICALSPILVTWTLYWKLADGRSYVQTT